MTRRLLALMTFLAGFLIGHMRQNPNFFTSRDLNEVESAIVEDFKVWIQDPMTHAYLKPHLPWSMRRSDLQNLADTAVSANYYAIDNELMQGVNSDGESWTRIADANFMLNRIRIYSDTYYWEYYTRDYGPKREAALKNSGMCSVETIELLESQAEPFGILCHENAHLARFMNHDVVYYIGWACEKAVSDMIRDRRNFCSHVY